MLSDEIIDKLIERLVSRIEKVNVDTLKDIAKIIKELRTLRPSDTHKLIQIMRYGGDYKKIIKKISEINKVNEKEIYEIFDELGKSDLQFAEQFYKYRNKNYIPWSKNEALRNQVKAMAEIAANEYANLSKTLAFARTVNGKVEYTELSMLYQDIIDKGVTAISQGKSTFDEEFRRTIKELSKSGIRSVNWESGTSRRLDSAVRMNLKTALRELHNETQKIIGKQIDADGVEITVHSNPAPDHQDAQGRQFTNEQYDRLQSTGFAIDYTGKEINLHRELKRTQASSIDFRPISQYNCYHYSFSVVLGVSEPLFSDEQLQEIIDKNNKGFDFEDKHYTMYEGTQLQRQIETAIRKEKDTQIMAKEAGQDYLAQESEKKIDGLLNKYVELSKESGLPTKMERLRVDGYKPIKNINNPVEQKQNIKYKDYFEKYYNDYDKLNDDERYKVVIDVDKTFEKKYGPIYQKMDTETKDAFNKYSGIYYKDINRKLLGLDLDDTDNYVGLKGVHNIEQYKNKIDDWTNKMDKAIDNAPIDENIVLWKGTSSKYYDKYKEGDVFSTKMYNSSSISRGVAETFTWNKQGTVVLKINCPKNTKGMYIGEGEFEILLGRKQKYKYIRSYEEIGKSTIYREKNKKIKIIELEAVK